MRALEKSVTFTEGRAARPSTFFEGARPREICYVSYVRYVFITKTKSLQTDTRRITVGPPHLRALGAPFFTVNTGWAPGTAPGYKTSPRADPLPITYNLNPASRRDASIGIGPEQS